MEPLPPIDLFAPVVELPPRCIGCVIAEDCVVALSGARRAAGEATTARMALLDKMRAQSEGRDAGVAVDFAARMNADVHESTASILERDEARADTAFDECAGFDTDGCGAPPEHAADIMAIPGRWLTSRRRSV